MRKQVCTAALSLALLPLAAAAQAQSQSQSAYGTQNSAANQSQSAYGTQNNTASQSQSAYGTQNNAATQSQQAYVAGQKPAGDRTHQGYVAGQNNAADRSQQGYMSGQNNRTGQNNMAGQSNMAGQNNMAGQGGQQAMGASGQGGATASGGRQAGVSQAPTFVLVPVVSPLREQWMRNGCWARLHDNQGFSGDSLTLTGPLDMPDMVGPFGINWQDKISSVETGANTTLTVYDNALYRDPVTTFKPGARIPDVSKRMGFFDQMRSLRITCTVR